jgi:hypothetical protein
MTFRGILEIIRDDANALTDTRRPRRRPGPPPRCRADLLVIDYAAHGRPAARAREAVTMANDGKSFAAVAASEWRSALDAMHRPGPRTQPAAAAAACGPVTDTGLCRNTHHTPVCARSMSSAASRVGFARPGSAESDAAWLADRRERQYMASLVASPAETAALAERERKAAEAKAERERKAALRETGANWALTGRGTGWLTQAAARGAR